jgi:hypothetical protein
MEKISLQEMVGGALQEQFERSFARVIENLGDPNTPFKDCRKITIELKFTQNEMRDDVNCAVKVVEKLAPQAPMQTAFVTGRDLRTGQVFAREYGKNIPLKGQLTMGEEPQVDVDPGTGEVVDSKPAVLDLRKVAAN